jgi:hypothetical protein
MNIQALKERLHLRIEQADEQMLRALDKLSELMIKGNKPEVNSQAAKEKSTSYESRLAPLTKDELRERALESERAIEAGEVYDIGTLFGEDEG